MTKVEPICSDGPDRPLPTEIEITPAMLAAAEDYWAVTYGFLDDPWPATLISARELFGGIYAAMARAR